MNKDQILMGTSDPHLDIKHAHTLLSLPRTLSHTHTQSDADIRGTNQISVETTPGPLPLYSKTRVALFVLENNVYLCGQLFNGKTALLPNPERQRQP